MGTTYYDTSTGRILARASGHGGPSIGDTVAQADGHYDPATQYLPGGIPTARAVINYTLDKPEISAGGEVATVTGLPLGTVVSHSMISYPTAAGSFTFDADDVGRYEFIIDQPEFLRTTITILVT